MREKRSNSAFAPNWSFGEPGEGETRFSRRGFLQGLAALLAWTAIGRRGAFAEAPPAAAGNAVAGDIASEPWLTLAAVQEHLFPAEDSAPGAKEIRATAYLQGVLNAPDADPEEGKFLMAGADWFIKRVAHDHGGRRFDELNTQDREQALRYLAESKSGENWIALLLYYLIEALLVDPVYGGNPGGVGWKWLDYRPGFPRPPAGKRYFELLSK